MRARNRDGSVVLDKRIKTWNFFFWENGKRRSKKIGTVSQYPTKASAWRAAKALRHSLENQIKVSNNAPTVLTLVEHYRAEKMPERISTRHGYNGRWDGFANLRVLGAAMARREFCRGSDLCAPDMDLW
jgi:hypothetical protein